jgi:hypothetical protein
VPLVILGDGVLPRTTTQDAWLVLKPNVTGIRVTVEAESITFILSAGLHDLTNFYSLTLNHTFISMTKNHVPMCNTSVTWDMLASDVPHDFWVTFDRGSIWLGHGRVFHHGNRIKFHCVDATSPVDVRAVGLSNEEGSPVNWTVADMYGKQFY